MAKAGTAILAMDDPDPEALARCVMDIAFGTPVDTLTGPSGPAAT